MNTLSKIGGRYKIQAFVPGNPPRILAEWFPNLITNYGMDLMSGAIGAYRDMWRYCSVGTGNAAPAFANTQLANRKATTDYRPVTTGGIEESYVWQRTTYQFAQGAAAGNLAEVGIGSMSSGAGLFSRALIKDVQGNPTTITVLPDEVLQVVWEVRHYFPTATTSTLTIAGSGEHTVSVALFNKQTSYNSFYGLKIINSHYYHVYVLHGTQGLFPETQSSIPSGTYDSLNNTANVTPYISGSFTRKANPILPVNLFNYTEGISGFKIQQSGESSHLEYQFFIDPPIMKTNEQQLNLTFSLNWARA